MPFGLTNAPATFQRAMNKLLNSHLDTFVVVYLDDVLIFSKTQEDHFQQLEAVFQLLRKHHIYIKLKKCSFFQKKATFLGYDIDEEGLHLNTKKLKKLKEWPEPKTKAELHSFLGFMQFLALSIKGSAGSITPFTNLMKQEADWKWGEKEQDSFQSVKRSAMEAPTLKLIDPEDSGAKYELHTSDSGYAIGVF